MQIIGVGTLTFRDKNTLEIVREVEQCNILQNNLIVSNFFGGDAFYSRQKPIGSDIVLLSRSLTPTPFMHETAATEVLAIGTKIEGVPLRKWVDKTETSPDYVQFKSRFLAPESNRTVNSVALSSGTGSIDTYLKLDVPVTQTPSEVLDVSYRVQWLWSDTGSISYSAALKFFKYWAGVTPVDQSGRALGQIDKGMIPSMCHSIARPGKGYESLNLTGQHRVGNDEALATNWVVPELLKIRNSVALGVDDKVGQIFATAAYAYDTNTDSKAAPDAVYNWEPMISAKAQNPHKHSSMAVKPFLDINFLAYGTGRIVPSAANWVKDWPEYYRLDIAVSGPIGTSEYKFARRKTVGFEGNQYKDRLERIPFWTSRSKAHVEGTAPYSYNVSAHGLVPDYSDAVFCTDDDRTLYTAAEYKSADVLKRSRLKRFDSTHVLSYDSAGVSKINLLTGNIVNYNASSESPMAATSIRQVVVNGTDIWVACADTGLYQISQDNIVTRFEYDFGGEAPCTNFYGVGFGEQDGMPVVVAATSQGFLTTTDKYVWNLFNKTSATVLNVDGVSNAWDSVSGIVVEGTQVLILRSIDTEVRPELGSVWWNFATGSSSTGPNIVAARCCDKFVGVSSGFWVALNLPMSYEKLTVGQSTLTTLFLKNAGQYAFLLDHEVSFEQHANGVGVVVAEFNEKDGSNSTFRVIKPDSTDLGVVPCDLNPAGLYKTTNDGRAVYRTAYLGSGMFLMHFDADGSGVPVVCNLACRTVSTTTPLAGVYTWLVWEQFGWDTEASAWSKTATGTKATQGYEEELVDGVKVSFVGEGDDAFLLNDYYTFGVCQGVMKDNATTLRFDNNFYAMPVVSVQEASYTVEPYTFTGDVVWKPVRNSEVALGAVKILQPMSRPQSSGAVSSNALVGDWSIQFSNPGINVEFGLAKNCSENLLENNAFTCISTIDNLKFSKTSGALHDVVAQQSKNPTDTVTFKKVGINVQMLVNDTVLYSAQVEPGNVYFPFVRAGDGYAQNALCPTAKILTNGTVGVLTLGSLGDNTGVYDPNFVSLEFDVASAVKVLISGAYATKKLVSEHSTPGMFDTQQVTLDPKNARIFFNASAQTLPAVVSYSYIKR